MKYLLLITTFLCSTVWADEITHQLGNSGYAIRWAMQEGAAKKSREHYWKAVALQSQAKAKFASRNKEEAMKLSQEAEAEARWAIKEIQ